MVKKIESPKFSFAGWRLKDWFKGNWKTIKEGIKVGLPLVVSMFFTNEVWQNFLITIVGKFIIDSGEYWFKEK